MCHIKTCLKKDNEIVESELGFKMENEKIKPPKKEFTESFITEDIDNLGTNLQCQNREIPLANDSNQENIVKIEMPYPPSAKKKFG